jgi:hypothetical protein
VNFDRKTYFDSVRASLFSGALSTSQVDGQEAILGEWEVPGQVSGMPTDDYRWLAYMLATTYHETSKAMWPIEEYGKGSGQPYGVRDPQTNQTYYGRGYVQLTWRDNYAKMTKRLGLKGDADLEWHAAMALDGQIAADVMFVGMWEGWFRSDSSGPQKLSRYFSNTREDPYGAREIINGDKATVPSWSNGVSIGNLIKGYYAKFLFALQEAEIEELEPAPEPEPEPEPAFETVDIAITTSPGALVSVTINGEVIVAGAA